MDIIEAIKERRSVRTFNGESLSESNRKQLMEAADAATSPFGGSVTIRLKEFPLKGEYKPGTYGMIRGAVDFFLIGMGDDEASQLSAGFRFEQVVLKAWQLGLGTCWIAATFKGSDFDRGLTWPDGESLRIISPVGVVAGQSIVERITRLSIGSKNRKPFAGLFFNGDFTRPLDPSGRFALSLDMMRLAPSSTNSQPWRALVVGTTVHFYSKTKNGYSMIDCGIGLCHFNEAERYQQHSGTFFKSTDAPLAPDGWQYVRSYRSAD